MRQVATRRVIFFAGWVSLLLAPSFCSDPLVWAGLAAVGLGTLARALQLSIRDRFILSAWWFLAAFPFAVISAHPSRHAVCRWNLFYPVGAATFLLSVLTFATAIAGALRALVIRLRPA